MRAVPHGPLMFLACSGKVSQLESLGYCFTAFQGVTQCLLTSFFFADTFLHFLRLTVISIAFSSLPSFGMRYISYSMVSSSTILLMLLQVIAPLTGSS